MLIFLEKQFSFFAKIAEKLLDNASFEIFATSCPMWVEFCTDLKPTLETIHKKSFHFLGQAIR